jgi:hypothetical protein
MNCNVRSAEIKYQLMIKMIENKCTSGCVGIVGGGSVENTTGEGSVGYTTGCCPEYG